MKKLMIALAAAATTMLSFGAGPSFEVSGTSFEGYPTNILQTAKGDDGSGTTTFWYTADQDAENIISNYFGFGETDPKEIPIASRPDYFAPSNNTKFLQLETTGKLFRSALPNDQTTGFAQVAIPDQGIYLDTLVKFTAADDVFGADALEADIDKIAIEYVEREDDDTTPEINEALTNFVVRAGYVTGSSTVVATNYLASVPAGFDKDAWHRLTVRAIADVGDGTVGFIVYLDGDMTKMLTYSTDVASGYDGYIGNLNNFVKENFYSETVHALFPSAVRTGGDKSNISAVAFSGNGSVDDVTFTVNKPGFIQEVTTVTVTWDTSKVTAVTLNGTGLTAEEWALGSCEIAPLNGGVVTFGANFAEGYTRGECTVTGGGNWDGSSAFENLSAGAVCNIVAMEKLYEVGDGVYFDDITKAVARAKAIGSSSAPATLKLLADVSGSITFSGEAYIVLDLNGMTLQGGSADLYTINNSGSTLTIIDSATGGRVLAPTKSGALGAFYTDEGTTTINGGIFAATVYTEKMLDPEASGDIVVTAGSFYDPDYDPQDSETAFYLKDYLGDGVGEPVYNAETRYFTIGGSQPTTFALTTTGGANATITTDPAAVSALTKETEVTITATAAQDYTYDGVDLGTDWTYDSQADAISMTTNVSENTTVVVPDAVSEQSQEDWPEGQDLIDAEGKAAGDLFNGITNALATADAKAVATWAEANNVAYADKGSILPEAFLLNCANTQAAIDEAAANFKITAITVSGDTVTITPADGADYGNGKVVIEGTATLSPISWHEKTDGDHFFRATLVVKPVAVP